MLASFESGLDKRKSVLLLIATAILWSSSGLFAKVLPQSAVTFWGIRGIFTATFFLAWLRPKTFRFTRYEIIAALAFISTQLFYIQGVKTTPAANAIFLQYTSVFYIIPLSFFFLRERPKTADFVTMIVVFLGMILFFWDAFNFSGVWGNVSSMLSGVCWAAMVIAMRKQKDADPVRSMLLGSLITAVIGLPFVLVSWQTFTPTHLSIYAFLGFIQIGFALILYTWAIRHVEALESTLITMLEPIMNPIWVFLVLGEVPGRLAMFGAILVMAGVGLRAVVSSRDVA